VVLAYTYLLQTADRGQLTTISVILALLCVVVLSSTGLAVLVGLTRRIHTIADQHPAAKPLADVEETDRGDHIDRQ
jgi:hypothetical protein